MNDFERVRVAGSGLRGGKDEGGKMKVDGEAFADTWDVDGRGTMRNKQEATERTEKAGEEIPQAENAAEKSRMRNIT